MGRAGADDWPKDDEGVLFQDLPLDYSAIVVCSWNDFVKQQGYKLDLIAISDDDTHYMAHEMSRVPKSIFLYTINIEGWNVDEHLKEKYLEVVLKTVRRLTLLVFNAVVLTKTLC